MVSIGDSVWGVKANVDACGQRVVEGRFLLKLWSPKSGTHQEIL